MLKLFIRCLAIAVVIFSIGIVTMVMANYYKACREAGSPVQYCIAE